MKASIAFDEARGVRFSTYAVPVILGEIKRLFRDGGMVKVSRSLRELSLKLNRYKDEFIAQNGREPTIGELSRHSGESEEMVAQAIEASQPTVSLTVQSEDGSNETDIPIDSSEEEILNSMTLRRALEKLDERDRNLLILRYFRSKTQTQTAQVLGMTQVQVSRREKKLLGILREEFL